MDKIKELEGRISGTKKHILDLEAQVRLKKKQRQEIIESLKKMEISPNDLPRKIEEIKREIASETLELEREVEELERMLSEPVTDESQPS